MRDVFHTISPEDILKINGDTWEWKGKKLPLETVANLKNQAKTFSESTLWKILKAELQWHAVKTLLEKGTSSADIRAAQLLGYLTQVVDDKLHSISESEKRRG